MPADPIAYQIQPVLADVGTSYQPVRDHVRLPVAGTHVTLTRVVRGIPAGASLTGLSLIITTLGVAEPILTKVGTITDDGTGTAPDTVVGTGGAAFDFSDEETALLGAATYALDARATCSDGKVYAAGDGTISARQILAPETDGAQVGAGGTIVLSGPVGPQGLPGSDGADGADGTDGTDGAQGPPGAPGISVVSNAAAVVALPSSVVAYNAATGRHERNVGGVAVPTADRPLGRVNLLQLAGGVAINTFDPAHPDDALSAAATAAFQAATEAVRVGLYGAKELVITEGAYGITDTITFQRLRSLRITTVGHVVLHWVRNATGTEGTTSPYRHPLEFIDCENATVGPLDLVIHTRATCGILTGRSLAGQQAGGVPIATALHLNRVVMQIDGQADIGFYVAPWVGGALEPYGHRAGDALELCDNNNEHHVLSACEIRGASLAGVLIGHSQAKGITFLKRTSIIANTGNGTQSAANPWGFGRFGIYVQYGSFIAHGLCGGYTETFFYLGSPNDIISATDIDLELVGRLVWCAGPTGAPWPIRIGPGRVAVGVYDDPPIPYDPDVSLVRTYQPGPLTLTGLSLEATTQMRKALRIQARSGVTNAIVVHGCDFGKGSGLLPDLVDFDGSPTGYEVSWEGNVVRDADGSVMFDYKLGDQYLRPTRGRAARLTATRQPNVDVSGSTTIVRGSQAAFPGARMVVSPATGHGKVVVPHLETDPASGVVANWHGQILLQSGAPVVIPQGGQVELEYDGYVGAWLERSRYKAAAFASDGSALGNLRAALGVDRVGAVWDTTSGLTLSGADVSEWRDRISSVRLSPQGVDIAPQLVGGGGGVVRFDPTVTSSAVSQRLQLDPNDRVPLDDSCTVYVAARVYDTTPGGYLVKLVLDGGGVGPALAVGGNTYIASTDGFGGTTHGTTQAATSADPVRLFSVVRDRNMSTAGGVGTDATAQYRFYSAVDAQPAPDGPGYGTDVGQTQGHARRPVIGLEIGAGRMKMDVRAVVVVLGQPKAGDYAAVAAYLAAI